MTVLLRSVLHSVRCAVPTALLVLATGCANNALNPPPPVDVLPTAPPQIVSTPRPSVATGGLFHVARYRPALDDRRARMVGDSVTVVIEETVTASQESSSSIDRKSATKGGITALPFLGGNIKAKTALEADSENGFSGKGDTVNKNEFKGSITTTVIEVLPNGHLVIAGEKQVGVNQNVDLLRFSGTVDPRTLQPGSTVRSIHVANVRIESRGRGAQSEAQAMGWLGRFFNTVTPF